MVHVARQRREEGHGRIGDPVDGTRVHERRRVRDAAEQLVGDVWEWTSSGFEPWPGFEPMLYAAYSAPFFGGDYRVLRGGAWSVAGSAIRPLGC